MSDDGDRPAKKPPQEPFAPFSLHQADDKRVPAWILIGICLIAFWAAAGFIAYRTFF